MKTTKETIKVGIVGCGYWGPNLARNLRQTPGCELKLICDASEQRLSHMKRLHPEVATTRRFEDLLNGADLDAVVIATPVRFHYEMAKACLSMGKHVFIEKPICATSAEAKELMKAAPPGITIGVADTIHLSLGVDVPADVPAVEAVLARR